jgi:mannose-6-phosphate isomerase-like protein (cupin superfamily)
MRRLLVVAAVVCSAGSWAVGVPGADPPPGFEAIPEGKVFVLADEAARREETGRPWLEFLTVPDLSMGIYALPVGEKDLQKPHLQDEIYVVTKGKAVVVIGEERTPVAAGSIIYVAKGVEHRFEDIEEDLETLVLFAVGKGEQ